MRARGFTATRFLLAGTCLVILPVMLSFAHPFGNPRRVDGASGPLLAGAQIPDPLRDLLQRKCGNCHSEAGEWPFYARVAPVSWLLERDVVAARRHMNLSRWGGYGDSEKSDLLGRLAAEARSGEMPPARYTALHRDAKLLAEEKEALYAWAKGERARLGSKGVAAAPDVETGAADGPKLFQMRCGGCHALDAEHEGPRLRGVVGRVAGTVKTFQYSEALRKAGFVWDEKRLDAWLTNTEAVAPGNDMAFRVAKGEERAEIIAYLKGLGQR